MRDRAALVAVVVALLLAVPAVAHAHAPLAPYRWVTPPTEVAAGNVAPLDRRVEVPAAHDRLPATEVWTGDLQAVVSFADTPLPARDRTSVAVALRPVDAAALGALPSSFAADGNAYEISVRDGDIPMASLPTAGRLVLALPNVATAVLYSADGATWTTVLPSSSAPDQVEVAFARPGYYLAATDHPLGGGGASSARGPLVAALVALPLALLAALLLLGRRLTRQRGVVST